MDLAFSDVELTKNSTQRQLARMSTNVSAANAMVLQLNAKTLREDSSVLVSQVSHPTWTAGPSGT